MTFCGGSKREESVFRWEDPVGSYQVVRSKTNYTGSGAYRYHKTENPGEVEEPAARSQPVSESSEGPTNVPNQLAILVPSYDPSKDDLQVYSQKVMLLLEAWPTGKYTELATRLILNSSGSAFKKLQLHQTEVTQNDRKSILKILELLGSHWGQIDLEQRYEYAERATKVR